MPETSTKPCDACGHNNPGRALYCKGCGGRLARQRRTRVLGGAQDIPPTVPAETRRLRGWMASFDFDDNGESFVLREGRNVVGRDPRDCGIFLAGDPRISRRHCLLVVRGDQVYVRDSESEHGTRVNGRAIGPDAVSLNDGDQLGVCGYNLTVKLL